MPPNDNHNEISRIPARICGLFTARGRSAEWEKALEQISKHFRSETGKPTHSRFKKKYCDENAVKDLIKRASAAPSTVTATKLTIAGMPLGRDGVKIVRTFSGPIGDTPELTCLIIIADLQGTLMTAYPGTKEAL